MNLSFSDEQLALRESAEAFLKDHSSSEKVRAAMASELGYDEDTWKRIATELGWAAVTVPEKYAGLGLGFVELVALMEVMGASLLCSPFFSTICLAANALLVGGSEEQKSRRLPQIAAGEVTATVAALEANGRSDAGGIETTHTKTADGNYVINGRKRFVVDGATADWIVVPSRAEGSKGQEGISLFIVASDAEGLSRETLATMDQTRRLANLQLKDVCVDAASLLGSEGQGWEALTRTLDLARIALAAEQIGGADRCLEISVEYAKERVQFGRPIGSFQAIKHKCADMMTAVESARSAIYYVGAAVDMAASGETGGDDLSVLAALASAYSSEAYFKCAGDSIQILGGVGFTWEYDVHLYFKRARASETLLGSPSFHRERIADHLFSA